MIAKEKRLKIIFAVLDAFLNPLGLAALAAFEFGMATKNMAVALGVWFAFLALQGILKATFTLGLGNG